MCQTIFPGGLCTRRCSNDRACGGGVCETQLQICLPSCTPHGGLECDQYGAACYPEDETGTAFVCFPSCFPMGATPPASFTNNCVAGTTCDPNLLFCSPNAPATGGAVGDACTGDMDCASGRCIAEVDAMTGEATGYIGGQCFTVGRLPAGSEYQMGMPLPRGNCPMGSVAIPFAADDAEGDPAICLKGCTADADCGREGYFCDHFGDPGAPAFSTGICDPINCNEAGRTCPSGYHCVTNPSDAAMPAGHCEAGGGDGGVTDGGSDGSVIPDVVIIPDVPEVDASIGD
jgi:hypothetical protein